VLVVATAVFLLPFAAPTISLGGHIRGLLGAVGHGFSSGLFLAASGVALRMAFPVFGALALLRAGARDSFLNELLGRRAFWLSLPVCLLANLVIASKNGAGIGHLVPFAPLLAYAFARLVTSVPVLAEPQQPAGLSRLCTIAVLAYAAGIGVAAAAGQLEVCLSYTHHWQHQRELRDDLCAVAESLPGQKVAVGFGNGVRYEGTWVRPELIRWGHPYAIEPVSLMDLRAEGVAIPAPRFFANCDVDVWLIPRGTGPFSMRNFYGDPQILPDEFGEYFLERWTITGSSRHFDLWERKTKGEAASGVSTEARRP